MNRKIFSNKVIFLLVVILGLAYFYLNLPDNFKIQLGGSGPPIPSECIPFTYKYRYLLYFGMVFAIIFAIYSSVSVAKLSKLGYGDYIKKGLDKFAQNSLDIKNKTITPDDRTAYDALVGSCTGLNQYSTYASSFCRILAPCTCCNEPGYYNSNCPPGTIGSKPPINTPAQK